MLKLVANFRDAALGQILVNVRIPLYRNAYALMLNTVSTSGLGILYWMIAAHYYDNQTVGLASAAISAMLFLSGLAQLNMASALSRFIPRIRANTSRFVGIVYLVSLIVALVVSLIFVAISGVLLKGQNFLGGNGLFTFWFIFSVMMWGIFTLQDGVMTGLRQAIWLPVENTAFGVVKIVMLIAFAAILPTNGLFLSWTIPMVLSLFPVNYLIFKILIPKHNANEPEPTDQIPAQTTVRQISKFIAGDYVGALFYLSSTALLPVLIVNRLGSKANAYFYIAWIIGNALDLLSNNMTTSLTVEAAADQTKLWVYSRKSFIHIVQLLLPIVALMLLIAPLVLSIFGNDYAANASTLLRLLSIAVLPKAVINLFLGISRVQNQVGKIVVVQAILCAMILSLTLILSGPWGIAGAGVAWLGSQTIVAGVLIVTQLAPLFKVHPASAIPET